MHSCFFSFSCIDLTCLYKYALPSNLLSHCLHWNVFSLRWTQFMCLCKSAFSPKALEHVSHLKGLKFSWTFLKCTFSVHWCLNPKLQIEHLNLFFNRWTKLTWFIRLINWGKHFLQIGHSLKPFLVTPDTELAVPAWTLDTSTLESSSSSSSTEPSLGWPSRWLLVFIVVAKFESSSGAKTFMVSNLTKSRQIDTNGNAKPLAMKEIQVTVFWTVWHGCSVNEASLLKYCRSLGGVAL